MALFTTFKVAHVRLCYSRLSFVRAYPCETQEMVFDAHAKAFEFFGGIPLRGIYDNMKTAVDTVFIGKDRKFNRRFLEMNNHYLIDPTACTPASGWEKGQVENQVGNIREWLFVPRLKFLDRESLNAPEEPDCSELTETQGHHKRRYRFMNAVPLNESNFELKVNVLLLDEEELPHVTQRGKPTRQKLSKTR